MDTLSYSIGIDFLSEVPIFNTTYVIGRAISAYMCSCHLNNWPEVHVNQQIFYSYPKPYVFLWDLPDSIIALIRDIFDFKVSIIIS